MGRWRETDRTETVSRREARAGEREMQGQERGRERREEEGGRKGGREGERERAGEGGEKEDRKVRGDRIEIEGIG